MTHPALKPKVSVVMCVLNGAPWIGRQLDALLAQVFDLAWEIIVVDNGSSDGTQAIVTARIATADVPLNLVDGSDIRGLPHARNVGALAAAGDTLAFCDCDDVVAPGWVAAAHRATQSASMVAGVNRVLTDPIDPDADIINPGGVIRATYGNAVVGCNFAVQRMDYLAVGGFDESLPAYGCDDFEFSIRFNEAGFVVVGAEDMQLYFRRTEDLGSAVRKTYNSALAETVVWARHPDRYARELSSVRRLVAVAMWPLDLVKETRRLRSLSLRSAVRDLTVRVGNLVGWWTMVRNGRVGGPQLIKAVTN